MKKKMNRESKNNLPFSDMDMEKTEKPELRNEILCILLRGILVYNRDRWQECQKKNQ